MPSGVTGQSSGRRLPPPGGSPLLGFVGGGGGITGSALSIAATTWSLLMLSNQFDQTAANFYESVMSRPSFTDLLRASLVTLAETINALTGFESPPEIL